MSRAHGYSMVRVGLLPGLLGLVLLLMKWATGIQASFWGKDSLFKVPLFGRWLRYLGGVPVRRTTSQGMVGQPEQDLVLDRLPTSALVSDIVYIPLETTLLAAARKRGNTTVNGLGMLLNQAIPAFEAWFGVKPEITDELRQAILATF